MRRMSGPQALFKRKAWPLIHVVFFHWFKICIGSLHLCFHSLRSSPSGKRKKRRRLVDTDDDGVDHPLLQDLKDRMSEPLLGLFDHLLILCCLWCSFGWFNILILFTSSIYWAKGSAPVLHACPKIPHAGKLQSAVQLGVEFAATI